MVEHTKKSRNIRHKTLKIRGGGEGGIDLGIKSSWIASNAKKELPTFESFYTLDPADAAIKDKLYKIS